MNCPFCNKTKIIKHYHTTCEICNIIIHEKYSCNTNIYDIFIVNDKSKICFENDKLSNIRIDNVNNKIIFFYWNKINDEWVKFLTKNYNHINLNDMIKNINKYLQLI